MTIECLGKYPERSPRYLGAARGAFLVFGLSGDE